MAQQVRAYESFSIHTLTLRLIACNHSTILNIIRSSGDYYNFADSWRDINTELNFSQPQPPLLWAEKQKGREHMRSGECLKFPCRCLFFMIWKIPAITIKNVF